MDRRVDETGPDSSTLWLAIGLGGFSVIASFFLAIYCSTDGVVEETAAAEANRFEVVEQASN
jgi:hypothetical protein